MDYDKYPDGHVPVEDVYEQYIFKCVECPAEFMYCEGNPFSEEDEELDDEKLREEGL